MEEQLKALIEKYEAIRDKKRELECYETALRHYSEGLFYDEYEKICNSLDSGLCLYFLQVQDINIYYHKGALPVLESMTEINEHIAPLGELEPRIEILKQAIATVKQQIHEQITKVSN